MYIVDFCFFMKIVSVDQCLSKLYPILLQYASPSQLPVDQYMQWIILGRNQGGGVSGPKSLFWENPHFGLGPNFPAFN